MTPHLEILPTPQRVFLDSLAAKVPDHFVLYGGTAIALRLGHRHSIDFDFFSDKTITSDDLIAAIPELKGASPLQASPNSYVYNLPIGGEPVKLSFFGGLGFGRVGDPDLLPGRFEIASLDDLFGTKLKVIHDRIEAKDYLDIAALLKSGISLDNGLSASLGLYPGQLNPLTTVKTLAWFKDGNLEEVLPVGTRQFLAEVAATFNGNPAPSPLRGRTLSKVRKSLGLQIRPAARRGSSFGVDM